MGFWDLDEGGSATNQGTDMEIGSGDFAVIPDGTQALAMIDEVKWDCQQDNGPEFISVRWSVLKPEEFSGRKVFQKLWVTDEDPRARNPSAKRDKAKKTLAAIDKNTSGGQMAKLQDIPTDEDLQANLMNVPVVIKIGVWDLPDDQRPGERIEGNWVMAVSSPKTSQPDDKAKPQQRRMSQRKQSVPANDPMDLDDDIPF